MIMVTPRAEAIATALSTISSPREQSGAVVVNPHCPSYAANIGHCVTDGTTFFLLNNTHGTHIELEHPFSPESLATGDFSSRPSASRDTPAFTELRDLLTNATSVVLGHTLPLMRLEPNSDTRTMIERGLGR
jgi:hypothetical protein